MLAKLFDHSIQVAFALLSLSLVTSMSGMEIFSWFIFVLFVLGVLSGALGLRGTLPAGTLPIVFFFFVTSLGIWLGSASLKDKLSDLGRMRFFLLYFVYVYLWRSGAIKFAWFHWVTGICAFVALYGFVQHFISIDLFRPEASAVHIYVNHKERIGPIVVGTFNHHLTFVNIFLPWGLFLIGVALPHPQRKIVPLMVGGLLLLDCFWTYSRTAWVAIPVTVFALLWARNRQWVSWIFIAFAAIFAVSYGTDSGLREKVHGYLLRSGPQYDPRVRLWSTNWNLFREYPLLGVGYNNNERMTKQTMDRLYPDVENNFYGHAHSVPLQLLATTGLSGFTAYFWIWWQILSQLLKKIRRLEKTSSEWWSGLALFWGFVAFHLQSLTQWNFGDAEVLHNLMFWWAMVEQIGQGTAGARALWSNPLNDLSLKTRSHS